MDSALNCSIKVLDSVSESGPLTCLISHSQERHVEKGSNPSYISDTNSTSCSSTRNQSSSFISVTDYSSPQSATSQNVHTVICDTKCYCRRSELDFCIVDMALMLTYIPVVRSETSAAPALHSSEFDECMQWTGCCESSTQSNSMPIAAAPQVLMDTSPQLQGTSRSYFPVTHTTSTQSLRVKPSKDLRKSKLRLRSRCTYRRK